MNDLQVVLLCIFFGFLSGIDTLIWNSNEQPVNQCKELNGVLIYGTCIKKDAIIELKDN